MSYEVEIETNQSLRHELKLAVQQNDELIISRWQEIQSYGFSKLNNIDIFVRKRIFFVVN